MYRIGVDMGGTNLAAGIVSEDGTIAAQSSVPTGEPNAEKIAKKTAGLIHDLMAEANISESEIEIIGVGVPGTANQKTGAIEYANNLGMEDVEFLELLRPYFPNTPLGIENDANAAAYAEYKFGAGQGGGSMVLITLGTGIGAGIIINGVLFEGINYASGELGHMTIRYDGLECNCGRRGCFERYASASALVEQAQAAMESCKDSLLWELCDGDISTMNGKLFFDAVRREDETALGVLRRYTEYLSEGILDIVNLLQPELVCIGGGISREGELLISPVREHLARLNYARTSQYQTQIKAAVLGNDAGIIGAAFLAAWRAANKSSEG